MTSLSAACLSTLLRNVRAFWIVAGEHPTASRSACHPRNPPTVRSVSGSSSSHGAMCNSSLLAYRLRVRLDSVTPCSGRPTAR
jgi:hypothetical protein